MSSYPCFEERSDAERGKRWNLPLALPAIALAVAGTHRLGKQASEEAASIAEKSGVVLAELIGLPHHDGELGAALEQSIARGLWQRQGGRTQRYLRYRDAQEIGQCGEESVARRRHLGCLARELLLLVLQCRQNIQLSLKKRITDLSQGKQQIREQCFFACQMILTEP